MGLCKISENKEAAFIHPYRARPNPRSWNVGFYYEPASLQVAINACAALERVRLG